MIIIEGLILLLILYIAIGLLTYIYGVLHWFKESNFWDFSIKHGRIAGVYEYPKWLLLWLEWVVRKAKRGNA